MVSRKIVLVQGAWGSSASWTPVANILRGMGHQVFVPSLTGLGERTHLFSGAINLDTHIGDVCGLVEAEGLEEFDLVGHSYGGMVITGVADRFAARIRTLTYLDAFLPENGQSALDLLGPEVAMANLAMAGELGGVAVPPPARHATRVPEHLRHYMTSRSPQPFATMIQKIKLSGDYRKITKRLYVSANIDQSKIFSGIYAKVGADPSWASMEVPSGHMLQLEMPEQVASIIHDFIG
ncbi:alpha/beta fold hydrolase [Neorhizobium galegae]|uniref:Alpha/beta hydrolase n=1 Tax=Neorhizobium galegae TaxID=399 RepID=A0A6A1TUK4_NEOGA|nr:alpha/beta hydrolase [Neorhizobium galegae]KAB1087956.1 alpha/beta hydrolase [Neorhizobium galegae]CDZ47480.1 Putative alkyl salicylate esterase [Neorhizobium galegae bv. orientalis]